MPKDKTRNTYSHPYEVHFSLDAPPGASQELRDAVIAVLCAWMGDAVEEVWTESGFRRAPDAPPEAQDHAFCLACRYPGDVTVLQTLARRVLTGCWSRGAEVRVHVFSPNASGGTWTVAPPWTVPAWGEPPA